LRLNTAVSVSSRRSAGRVFDREGSATEKAHPANFVFYLCTIPFIFNKATTWPINTATQTMQWKSTNTKEKLRRS